jgi:Na+/H+ antiporter NhaC
VAAMKLRDRFFKFTDAPFTWTRAILLGSAIWVFTIITMGQIPSLIIYKFDQYIAEIIEFTGKLPLVNDEGLNSKQIQIIRDMVNNGVQLTFLAMLLIFMYFWQEKKRKRTGAKGLEDPVKGYMSGK